MNKKDLIKQGDKLVTPLAKSMYPNCEACGNPTQVGHHFIEKSRSNYLRFKPINFIGLCMSCHSKIHNQFGNNIMGSVDLVKKIEQERGKKWVKKIRSWEHKSVKADIIYWQQEVNNLKQCLDGSSQILS